MDEDERSAKVVVPEDQLSLAIGKEGQNARLAVRLTGYKIDIKSESQAKSLGIGYDDYDEEYDEEYDDEGYYDDTEDAGDYDDDVELKSVEEFKDEIDGLDDSGDEEE